MNNLVIIDHTAQTHDIHIYKLDPQFQIEKKEYDEMLDFIVDELGFPDDVDWFIDYGPTTVHVYACPDAEEESTTLIEI